MFKAIGSALGRVLGTDKAFEAGIERISSGLDKLHYGDQEKAEHQMQHNQAVRDFIIDWHKSTDGQNTTRRLIALPVAYTWLFMFVFMAVCSVLSIWVDGTVSVLNEAGKVVQVNGLMEAIDRVKPYAIEMKEVVMIVVVFYFGPHILQKAQNMFGEKK